MPGGRLRAVVGLGVARVVGRLRIAPQRVLLSVLGIGLAVGLMVAVTGVSVGLASQSLVASEDVDYWVVPEGADVQSVAVSTGSVKLGDVHDTATRVAADDRVDAVTPVLIELVPVRDAATGERTYVLAVGVVAQPDVEVLGLSTAPLTPGDPYYANGSYDGPWTGEVVLSDAAATLTNASTGADLRLATGGGSITNRTDRRRSLTITNVSSGATTATALGSAPVAVLHLSELQALTNTQTGDQADQLLVSTTDPGVRQALTDVYPETTVVTRSGVTAQGVSTSDLSLALALGALVAAVVVGVLFVTTLMGLEVSADRRHLGTLAAVGVSGRTRAGLITVETLVVAMLGGVVGLLLGGLGIMAVNRLGADLFGVGQVAVFHPLLVGYALVVAAVIGAVGAIYPLLVAGRTDPLEMLRP